MSEKSRFRGAGVAGNYLGRYVGKNGKENGNYCSISGLYIV